MDTNSYYVFLVRGARVFKPMILPNDSWNDLVRMAQIAIRGRKVDFGIVVSARGAVIGVLGQTARDVASDTNAGEIMVGHTDAFPKFPAAWKRALSAEGL